MTALFRPFLDLLFFRGKVQDIPASSSLLTLVAAGCMIVQFINGIKHNDYSAAFTLAAAQIVLLALFLKILFALNKKPERWLQVVTALLGVQLLTNILTLPLNPKLETDAGGQFVLSTDLMLIALLEVWAFVIMARALKESLELRMGRAVMLSFFLSYGIALTIIVLFGNMLTAGITPLDQ